MSFSLLHPLRTFLHAPARFTNPFSYEPHPFVRLAAAQVNDYLCAHAEWAEDLQHGKMFGVLVVRKTHADASSLHFLAAFSGQLDGKSQIDYFVPPIYDLLHPDSHFQHEQSRIDSLNHRLAAHDIDTATAKALREERKSRSEALQQWLFDQYLCRNARGETATIPQIFKDYYQRTMLHPERFEQNALKHHIPSGTGDCCAPKLLQTAYQMGVQPLCMGEWWVGASPRQEIRHAGLFYPACHNKCRPLLSFMLQGLDVEESLAKQQAASLLRQTELLYQDDHVIALNKPSGLLSVPGRDESPSVLDWLTARRLPFYYPAHRLDQDTSGILLVARTENDYRQLQSQFVRHLTTKRYIALLSRPVTASEGEIRLALRPDFDDRPRQLVDPEHGKQAVTHFRVLDIETRDTLTDPQQAPTPCRVTRIELLPDTGRTHQLRVHCAHPDGLGAPILGDRLYGRCTATHYPHLCLHAASLDFLHPVSQQRIHLECPAPF